jgi:predicted amidohydrolase
MKISISLAQISIEPNHLQKNFLKTTFYIEQARSLNAEILLFPEMWLTGFHGTYHRQYAQAILAARDALGDLAKKHSLWIGGSLPYLHEDERMTNAFVLFNKEGSLAALYHKIHLFSPLQENESMSPGKELILHEFPWGKCGFAICYDLRFPEMFRSYALQGVKVIFLTAAFPYPRLEHWKTLIRARAIENQLYMVCVNRVGTEDFSHGGSQLFFGSSMIVNPWGDVITLGSETEEMLLTAELDLAIVDTIRHDIPIFKDRQPHVYNVTRKD